MLPSCLSPRKSPRRPTPKLSGRTTPARQRRCWTLRCSAGLGVAFGTVPSASRVAFTAQSYHRRSAAAEPLDAESRLSRSSAIVSLPSWPSWRGLSVASQTRNSAWPFGTFSTRFNDEENRLHRFAQLGWINRTTRSCLVTPNVRHEGRTMAAEGRCWASPRCRG